jgi:hypothetical protein
MKVAAGHHHAPAVLLARKKYTVHVRQDPAND